MVFEQALFAGYVRITGDVVASTVSESHHVLLVEPPRGLTYAARPDARVFLNP